MHHNGNLEDNHNVLLINRVAADLMLFQPGCITDNADWKVRNSLTQQHHRGQSRSDKT